MSRLKIVAGYNGKSFIHNLDTGRIEGEVGTDGKLVYSKKQNKRPYDFVIFPQHAIRAILDHCNSRSTEPIHGQDKDDFKAAQRWRKLDFTSLKVYLYCLAVCKNENWIDVSQKDIAVALNIHPVSVSESFKTLHEMDLVQTISDEKNSFKKCLNPLYSFMGSKEMEDAAVARMHKQQFLDFIPTKE